MRLKALRPDDVVTVRAEVIILMLRCTYRFKLDRGTVRPELDFGKVAVLTRFYSAMTQLVREISVYYPIHPYNKSSDP